MDGYTVYESNSTSDDFNFIIWANALSSNPTQWLNTLKQFVGNLPTNCLIVFDLFMGLVLKGLTMFKLLTIASKMTSRMHPKQKRN